MARCHACQQDPNAAIGNLKWAGFRHLGPGLDRAKARQRLKSSVVIMHGQPVKGSKRYLLVDVLGWSISNRAEPANLSD